GGRPYVRSQPERFHTERTRARVGWTGTERGRLSAFEQSYDARLRGHRTAGVPERVTIDDVIVEYDRNAYRTETLLQGVAFQCSAEVLVLKRKTDPGSRARRCSRATFGGY